MPRVPREEAAGAIHHVVPQGNGRRPIVEDDEDRFAFVRRFSQIQRELGWLAHASCLLDTHHHVVVETPEPNLGAGMRRLLGGHSRWLNVRHGGEGSVFAPHFWSRRITDDGWFLRACLYVVLNPVVAGVCAHPRDWRWCSYTATADGDRIELAPGEQRLLRMFGKTAAEARDEYARVVDRAVAGIHAERLCARAVWRSLGGVERPRSA